MHVDRHVGGREAGLHSAQAEALEGDQGAASIEAEVRIPFHHGVVPKPARPSQMLQRDTLYYRRQSNYKGAAGTGNAQQVGSLYQAVSGVVSMLVPGQVRKFLLVDPVNACRALSHGRND